MKRICNSSLLAVVAFWSACAGAQSPAYPDKPVKVLVGYVAGGGSDATARFVAQTLSKSMGQQFVVENRPGAGGNIAAAAVARSAPDGYTLLVAPASLTTNPSIYASMPFDALKDLAPIVMVTVIAKSIAVHPGIPAQDIAGLIAYAKANPGKASCASAGAGSVGHLSCELFNRRTGTNMVHVAYKGSAAAMTDTISGQVPVLFDDVTTQLSHVRAGRLRVIAVTSAKRNPHLPDVPTADESGLPGFIAQTWVGVLAPAGTPTEIVQRINADMNKALLEPEVRARIAAIGMEHAGGTAEQFAGVLKDETALWAKVVKDAGLKLQ